MNLYERIEALCQAKGTNITSMCRESGASRSSLTDLKSGRKQSLSADTLLKIAGFFGVSVDALLNDDNTEEPRSVSDEDIQFALFGGRVSDEAYEDVKKFAAFIKHKYNEKKE